MLRELLQKLEPAALKRLRYAFEQGIAQFVVIDGGKFVGVNVRPLKNLKILEESGDWSYGEML